MNDQMLRRIGPEPLDAYVRECRTLFAQIAFAHPQDYPSWRELDYAHGVVVLGEAAVSRIQTAMCTPNNIATAIPSVSATQRSAVSERI